MFRYFLSVLKFLCKSGYVFVLRTVCRHTSVMTTRKRLSEDGDDAVLSRDDILCTKYLLFSCEKLLKNLRFPVDIETLMIYTHISVR